MNAVFYPAVFHPEATGYSVTVPDIEGCFTQGDTMDEAVRMAQDAIGLMLEECAVCPTPSVPSSLPVELFTRNIIILGHTKVNQYYIPILSQ